MGTVLRRGAALREETGADSPWKSARWEAEVALQQQEEDAEAMQDMGRYAHRVRRRLGLTQIGLARRIDVPHETNRNGEQGKRCPTGGGARPVAGARQGPGDRAPSADLIKPGQ